MFQSTIYLAILAYVHCTYLLLFLQYVVHFCSTRMNRRLFSRWLIFASFLALFLKRSSVALNRKRGILLHYTYTKSSITIPYHPAFKVFMQRSSPVFNRVSQEWNRLLWQLKQWDLRRWCCLLPHLFFMCLKQKEEKIENRSISGVSCSIWRRNLLFSRLWDAAIVCSKKCHSYYCTVQFLLNPFDK